MIVGTGKPSPDQTVEARIHSAEDAATPMPAPIHGPVGNVAAEAEDVALPVAATSASRGPGESDAPPGSPGSRR